MSVEYNRLKHELEIQSPNNVVARQLYNQLVIAEEHGATKEEALAEVKGTMREAVDGFKKAHGEIERIVSEDTGLALADYLWLRNFAPPEREDDGPIDPPTLKGEG